MAIDSKMSRSPIGRPQSDSKNSNKWIWIVVVVILALGGVWYIYSKQSSKDVLKDLQGGVADVVIDTGEFQAVFLDNGQVYFGKLKRSSKTFYELTDVFYMQSGNVGLDKTSNLSLSKLGGEAHGPEDKMNINVDHILFIENMTTDSKVVKAIKQYKSK